jgi:fatty-acyl-CoA synthase
MIAPVTSRVQTSGTPTASLTVGALLRRAAADNPDRDAVVVGATDPAERRRLTYAELLHDVERCSAALLERFEPGERVAIWAPNVPQWVTLQLSLGLSGLVMVALNPSARPREAEYVLRRSRSAGCFVVPEHGRGRPLEALESLRAQLPDLREVVGLDSWEAFLASAPARSAFPAVAPEDCAQIQYTSGTTGFPKGAMLRHGGIVENALHMAERAGIGPESVFVRPSLLYHVGGSVASVLLSVAAAATIVPMTAWDPALALELVEAERATLTGGVPTMVRALLEHPDLGRRDVTSLRQVILGAAPVPPELVRELRARLGVSVVTMFGQTESGPTITMTHPDDTPEDTAETVGTLLPGFEAKIVEPDGYEELATGAVGELVVRSRMIMAGYFEDPGQTARTIDADGWLRTGDLCSVDDRGYYRVVGRLKDMIIRGGANIYPREIEEAILRHESVAVVAVVGLPDDYLGEAVAAFVRPAPGHVLDPAALTAFLAPSLARYKLPSRWFAVEHFPITASGKIQKHVLREQFDRGDHAETTAERPTGGGRR